MCDLCYNSGETVGDAGEAVGSTGGEGPDLSRWGVAAVWTVGILGGWTLIIAAVIGLADLTHAYLLPPT